MTQVRLESAAPWSRVKQSTTGPLRSLNAGDEMLNIIIRYSNVIADILLFGNMDLPVQINEEIFKTVHA